MSSESVFTSDLVTVFVGSFSRLAPVSTTANEAIRTIPVIRCHFAPFSMLELRPWLAKFLEFSWPVSTDRPSVWLAEQWSYFRRQVVREPSVE